MRYILTLILLLNALPGLTKWNPEDDIFIKAAYDDGCFAEAECLELRKKEGYEIMDGVAIAGCKKVMDECSSIRKAKIERMKEDLHNQQIQTLQFQINNLQNQQAVNTFLLLQKK